ncbi:hypothetical protein BDV96DRAFT_654698 [Lophiotrema nucula]|uniref:F-box domain-containing protein n=1 Tax=Lophiotrema nucula TaxID=690887 RepID=A0A6A5YIF5_9PLEO|nr:hypothetical protein BDV96DRAFT_654698 [Lophiotrema nucula]
MASFLSLPTELRHEILRWVVVTPLPPPYTPDDVQDGKWLHIAYKDIRYKVDPSDDEDNHCMCMPPPRTWINSSLPWDSPYLPLLLVNKSIKLDTEVVLKRADASMQMQPILDIFVDDDLYGTWLRLPPYPRREIDTLEVNIRCHRAKEVTSHADFTNPAVTFWGGTYPPGQIHFYLFRILNVRHNRYRQIGLGKRETHIKTIRVTFCTPPPELGIRLLHKLSFQLRDSSDTYWVQPHPFELAQDFAKRWAKRVRRPNIRGAFDIMEVFVDETWCFRVRSDSAPVEGGPMGLEANEGYRVPVDPVFLDE